MSCSKEYVQLQRRLFLGIVVHTRNHFNAWIRLEERKSDVLIIDRAGALDTKCIHPVQSLCQGCLSTEDWSISIQLCCFCPFRGCKLEDWIKRFPSLRPFLLANAASNQYN